PLRRMRRCPARARRDRGLPAARTRRPDPRGLRPDRDLGARLNHPARADEGRNGRPARARDRGPDRRRRGLRPLGAAHGRLLERAGAEAQTIRDGWLYTGDMGRLDEEGYVTITDRKKDLIIRGGFNVFPRDVEEALLEHPVITSVCVLGRPD